MKLTILSLAMLATGANAAAPMATTAQPVQVKPQATMQTMSTTTATPMATTMNIQPTFMNMQPTVMNMAATSNIAATNTEATEAATTTATTTGTPIFQGTPLFQGNTLFNNGFNGGFVNQGFQFAQPQVVTNAQPQVITNAQVINNAQPQVINNGLWNGNWLQGGNQFWTGNNIVWGNNTVMPAAPAVPHTGDCKDDDEWEGVGFGKCSTYALGQLNHQYCLADKADAHCKVACQQCVPATPAWVTAPTQGPTEPPPPETCFDDELFSNTWGNCASYAKGKRNHVYCDIDKVTDICPKACGKCTPQAAMPTWTAPVATACMDNPNFNVGFGNCDTYKEGQPNAQYCVGDKATEAGDCP